MCPNASCQATGTTINETTYLRFHSNASCQATGTTINEIKQTLSQMS